MGLRENILKHSVSELDLREAVTVARDVSVREAVKLMKQHRLGCVVIVDQEDKAIGKFTERCLMRLLVDRPAALDEPVGQCLSADCGAVTMTDPIAKVIEIMQANKSRFVFVLDDQGKPVALTGQKGVMAYLADHFPRQVKVQLMKSKLYMDQREGG